VHHKCTLGALNMKEEEEEVSTEVFTLCHCVNLMHVTGFPNRVLEHRISERCVTEKDLSTVRKGHALLCLYILLDLYIQSTS